MIFDNDESIYSMSLGLLYVLKDFDPFSNFSRMALLLDRKSFDVLIDNFGGTTVRIPTRVEVNSMLKSLVYYQLRYLRGMHPYYARQAASISNKEADLVDKYSDDIKMFFDKFDKDKLHLRKNPDVVDVKKLLDENKNED